MSVLELELDTAENIVDGGVTTLLPGIRGKYHYVRAPPGIDGIEPGTKLTVVRQFKSDAECPYGEGLTCLELEGGLMAVFTPDGIAWLQLDDAPTV